MGNKIVYVVAVIGLFVVVIATMVSILSGGGNALGELSQRFAIGGLVIGILAPRPALFVLFIVSGYLDLFKRLLLFDGSLGMLDLIYVLSISPAIQLGICGGVVIQWALGKIRPRKIDFIAVGAVVAMIALSFFREALTSGMMGAMQSVAQGSAFMTSVFLVPLLVRNRKEMEKLLKVIVMAYLPVAIYGIYQAFAGLSNFEIAYLESGYTIQIKQLMDVRPRPFSTLNAPSTLGTICAYVGVLALALRVLPKPYRKVGSGEKIMLTLIALLYFFTNIVILSRLPNIVWFGTIFTTIIFLRPKATLAVYISAVIGFFILIFNAETLIPKLNGYTSSLLAVFGDSDAALQTFRMGTLGSRFGGYANLLNGKELGFYTAFGQGFKSESFLNDEGLNSHDMIGEFILNYGLVPFVIVLFLGVIFLRKAHSWAWRRGYASDRKVYVYFLSLIFWTMVLGVLGGNIVAVFPVSLFIYSFIGLLLSMMRIVSDEIASEKRLEGSNPSIQKKAMGYRGSRRLA